ncbi:biotin-dependent carboxyltransferase family protein [Hymenobacter sp. GOD-10R]|uniref:5-oxoprolinase subunit C family protein n=1 Tax=Hymenobacter sp. GOD-10R TaxID=3093922 RepID=UPI002D782EB6|nr:biotin-dependent carboxyltransferase family protein [Hymenobacter sp. GOD-10R]WRQ27824.1 biotin-dependent carboxyltransferase family protein [Hymenobacter sp. GOD-10R]
MSLSIISPGLLTTIQDLGRHGYRKEGVPTSGAMDTVALRVANLLVGNTENTAGIEITFLGPKIRFETDQLLALTGADLRPTLNGESVKMNRPVAVRKGSILAFSGLRIGSRAYLALSGGLATPLVLGSQATYLRAGIGGLGGRAFKTGDVVPTAGLTELGREIWQALLAAHPSRAWVQTTWTPDPKLYPTPYEAPHVRAIRGQEYDLFSEQSQRDFWQHEFIVTSDSDRMGYRLQGPMLVQREPSEVLSSAVTFGTIQVPHEGHPIALLADHQTTGGYPRIAQVIAADFSCLAQVPLGRKIGFREISLAEAHDLYARQEKRITEIKQALQYKLHHL